MYTFSYLSVSEGPSNYMSHGPKTWICLFDRCDCQRIWARRESIYKPPHLKQPPAQSALSLLHCSPQVQHLSHDASGGPWPPPSMCGFSKQICCYFRRWHAHPLGTNTRPNDWLANTEWDCDSRPLEFPSPHEFVPAADNWNTAVHGKHGAQPHRQSYMGAATAAWMDVHFR